MVLNEEAFTKVAAIQENLREHAKELEWMHPYRLWMKPSFYLNLWVQEAQGHRV